MVNPDGITNSYDAFGNVSVSGNTEIQNPYTYNAEYIDASTGNQYLRARYYDLEEGIFLTQDSYLGSLLEPLSQNLYTYAENNPVNYSDPSGHGILSKIKSAAKKVATTVKNTYNKAKTWVKNTYNKAKNWVSNTYQNAKKALTNVVSSSGSSEKNKSGKSSSGGRYSSGGSNAGNRKYSSSSRGSGKSNFYRPSTYERAKSFGQSRYNWFSSKMKESGNIRNSWTKAIEKTVRKFCTTASRIKKDAVRSVKAANIAIGISAITIGKMKLEQLKKKLPNINISIDYTGTWKDSLQLGLGIVTTGGGLLLTLVGGGSEIASVGSSSAISIPAATEGIGIAGSGLAISLDALRNMFDVRIQKSESSKGSESGKNGSDTSEALNKEGTNSEWHRMTLKESRQAAKKLGYEKTNYRAKNGEPIYYNKKTKTYISQDIGSADGSGPHNGGVWKMGKSPQELNSKSTRLGTYDGNLNRIGD